MATKIKALQQWCRKMTDGYRDVEVKDFTTSWRNGLAFCALIHRFRPDLIDYDSLSKENVFENNQLAFTVAEQELDITAFLEAADMVALKTPDKLSVITYVSQYYNKLGALPQLGGPGVQGKSASASSAGTKRLHAAEPLSEPETKKQPPAKQVGASADNKTKGKSLGDRCAICNNKVYLLERHIEDGKLYHRSCYRHSDLSPTNKVYTRSPFLSPSLHGKEADVDKGVSDRKQTSVLANNNFIKSQTGLLGSDEKNSSYGAKQPSQLKDSKTRDRPAEIQGSGINKNDLHTDKQFVSRPQVSSATKSVFDTAVTGKPSLPSQSQQSGGQTVQNHSIDYLSAEKDVKDVKTPKRQLPLIFQAAKNTSDSAIDSSKGISEGKRLFTKDIDSSSKSSVSPRNKVESSSKSESSLKTSLMSDSNVSNKILPEKNASEASSEKSTHPVVKPRRFGQKVSEEKMNTSATTEGRDRSPARSKSPAFPRPSPRSAFLGKEISQTSTPKETKYPPAPRKALPRSKSPARDLSPKRSSPPPLPSSAPPPLPSSAPPPLPSSAPPKLPLSSSPSASPLASPRHLPASPQPTPRQRATLASAHQDKMTENSRSADATSKNSSQPSGDKSSKQQESASASKISAAVAGSNLRVSSSNTSKSATSGSYSQRHEEPMDIDSAFNKARGRYGEEPVAVMVVPVDKEQQEKTVLTGLLKSLAHLRNTPSSTVTPTPTSSSHNLPSQSSAITGKVAEKNKVPTSESNSSSSGFVSSKVNHLHTKDASVGLVQNSKSQNNFPLSSDIRSSEVAGKSGASSKSTELGKRISAWPPDTSNKKDLPEKIPSKSVGAASSTQVKTVEESSKQKSSLLSSSDTTEKDASTGYTPLYKKKQSRVPKTNGTAHSAAKDCPDNDRSEPKAEIISKKTRPKSAIDIVSRKDMSVSQQIASTTGPERPPPFTQVKLRESGYSTLERKERAKSVENLSAASAAAESKPEWQLAAERKMAKFQNLGFVDPETKKSTSERESPVEDEPVKGVNVTKMPEITKPKKLAVQTVQKKEEDTEALRKETKKNKVNEMESISKSSCADSVGKLSKPDPASGRTTSSETIPARPKGILKRRDKSVSPPPKPRRALADKDRKQEGNISAASQSGDTSKLVLPPKFSQDTKVTYMKKITGDDVKDDLESHSTSSSSIPAPPSHKAPAPPVPSQPPGQGRKKISVDIKFDFDLSSSVEVTPKEIEPSPDQELTPSAEPPLLKRTSMSPGRLSAIELQQQLLDIDCKLSELELRGRHLEDSIRSVAAEEEDDLMMEWFQLVTEKNELVRRECDLVYLSREQDLEDEQSQIESQLHYLLSKDESEKSFEEHQEEEYLIQRKLDIVNQRNSIVESMDEDRLRYEEEDRDIAQVLQEKGYMKDSSTPQGKAAGKGQHTVGSSMFYT